MSGKFLHLDFVVTVKVRLLGQVRGHLLDGAVQFAAGWRWHASEERCGCGAVTAHQSEPKSRPGRVRECYSGVVSGQRPPLCHSQTTDACRAQPTSAAAPRPMLAAYGSQSRASAKACEHADRQTDLGRWRQSGCAMSCVSRRCSITRLVAAVGRAATT